MPVKERKYRGKGKTKERKNKRNKKVRFKSGKHQNIFGDFFANYRA
jgi:hypothetical protein